jgi:pimeloyl-ACP methyl ester carboxylesterase
MRFAIDHPGRIRELVLVGAFASYRRNTEAVTLWADDSDAEALVRALQVRGTSVSGTCSAPWLPPCASSTDSQLTPERGNVMMNEIEVKRREPVQPSEPSITGWRHQLWLTLLIAGSVAFTTAFACAAPFAAFSAAAALTLSRRDALLLTIGVWLANQLTGFLVLAYPWTLSSLAWAPLMGAAPILGTLAALGTVPRLAGARPVTQALAALMVAFAVFEVVTYAVSLAWLGGTQTYAPSIITRVFVTNVGALVGLCGLYWLGTAVGLRRRTTARIGAPAHPV